VSRCPGYDPRILDDQGNEVAPGTPGMLLVRGGSTAHEPRGMRRRRAGSAQPRPRSQGASSAGKAARKALRAGAQGGPCHHQVDVGITDGEQAEVEHAARLPIDDEQVCRVKVAVHPQCPAVPRGSGSCAVPRTDASAGGRPSRSPDDDRRSSCRVEADRLFIGGRRIRTRGCRRGMAPRQSLRTVPRVRVRRRRAGRAIRSWWPTTGSSWRRRRG